MATDVLEYNDIHLLVRGALVRLLHRLYSCHVLIFASNNRTRAFHLSGIFAV